MQIFTIDQCYNSGNYRTVLVRAPSLGVALSLANEAEETEYDDSLGDTPPPPEGEAGILSCTAWDSSSFDNAGETFTIDCAAGVHDGTGDVPEDEMLVTPPDFRQFRTEWVTVATLISQMDHALRDALVCLTLPQGPLSVDATIEKIRAAIEARASRPEL